MEPNFFDFRPFGSPSPILAPDCRAAAAAAARWSRAAGLEAPRQTAEKKKLKIRNVRFVERKPKSIWSLLLCYRPSELPSLF